MWHFPHGILDQLAQKLVDFIHLGDFLSWNNKNLKRLHGLKTILWSHNGESQFPYITFHSTTHLCSTKVNHIHGAISFHNLHLLSSSFFSCYKNICFCLVHNFTFLFCNVALNKPQTKLIISNNNCAIHLLVKLHKLFLGVKMKTRIGGLQTFTTKAKNLNKVSLCDKTIRDFCFGIQSHIAQPFESLEVRLCLIFIIYMLPWWKFKPHFSPRFFLFVHHLVIMKWP